MALSTIMGPNLATTRLSTVMATHRAVVDRPTNSTTSTSMVPASRRRRLAESLSHLLHHTMEGHPRSNMTCNNWDLVCVEKQSTPVSPKEVLAHRWQEIHGSKGWDNLMDPLDPCLRREIVKYGEFAQATYDGFDFDSLSEYCGSCRYNRNKIFEALGLEKNGYEVTKYIYAMSHIDVPKWLERSHLVDTWSKHSNWMGYVAVSSDEETCRIGRRDIVVVWRGTVAPTEWYEDCQRDMKPIEIGSNVKVEHGFHNIYTSKCDTTRYNKLSASNQVMGEIKRLVEFYKSKGEQVSLTITGHSLGGALALLNAHETASTIPNLPISVISFGAPRVGNMAFRDQLENMGVHVLRLVIEQDFVPKSLGFFFNEGLGALDWVYTHVGRELRLDVESSPYLKHGLNLPGSHSLETYLHLVDGYHSSSLGFREDVRRDIALVNKACDMLVEELRIPHCWFQLANKGLVCNGHGRWVKPKREPEDIPSPVTSSVVHDDHLLNHHYEYSSEDSRSEQLMCLA